MFNRPSAVERRLNKLAPLILIGGLFFTLSMLFFMTLCNSSCEDKLYGLDNEVLQRAKSKAFWKGNPWSGNRDLKSKLAILIISAPSNMVERSAIRETWLKDSSSVLYRFVVGTSSLPIRERQKLERENLVHEDVLMLDNVKDSYENLTFKVLQAFLWLDRTVDFQYLLKVDDDSFVRISNILSELQHKPKEKLYWGFFNGNAHVKTTGKWKETEYNLCDRYLPYARGGGYVLSNDLVHYIANNNELFQLYLSEDVSVGTWLAPLKLNRHHDQNFDTEYISRGCLNSYLVMHKQPVNYQRQLQHNLITLGHLCTTEIIKRPSYEYNWNYPPSNCCQRIETKRKGHIGL